MIRTPSDKSLLRKAGGNSTAGTGGSAGSIQAAVMVPINRRVTPALVVVGPHQEPPEWAVTAETCRLSTCLARGGCGIRWCLSLRASLGRRRSHYWDAGASQ
jgi:hypothetical protein